MIDYEMFDCLMNIICLIALFVCVLLLGVL